MIDRVDIIGCVDTEAMNGDGIAVWRLKAARALQRRLCERGFRAIVNGGDLPHREKNVHIDSILPQQDGATTPIRTIIVRCANTVADEIRGIMTDHCPYALTGACIVP